MYFTHVVATFVDRLDQEFLDRHRTVDNGFHSLNGRIDRTVTGSGCFELLACDIQTNTGHRLQTDAGGYL